MPDHAETIDAHQNPTVIFLHIPKTAGRTLQTALERQYSSDRIYNTYGYKGAIPEAVERLKELPENEKRQLELVQGHYQFGLHKYLPQVSTYITLLRDPVDRVISHYYYVISDDKHPLRRVIQSRNLSLKEYVQSGISIELNNGQTRLISGREKSIEFGQCSSELLDEAKRNIDEHFCVAGTVKRFDESLVLMKLSCGWIKPICYARRNVAKRRPSKTDIPEETLRVIRKYNELDIELYEYAKERLERQVAERASDVETELRRLRIQNRFYQPYSSLTRACLAYGGKLKGWLNIC